MSDTLLIRCPNCGATNRLRPKQQQTLQPICGQCKTPLAGYEPVTGTDATFAAEVERSPLPVLLDLWAPGCGPCRRMGQIMAEVLGEMSGRVRVAKREVY